MADLNESPDILWGLEAIGREAGCVKEDGSTNVRVTLFRIARGFIPAWKRGDRWQSSRSVIRKQLTSGENAA